MNWFSLSLSKDMVTQLTNVGDRYYLRNPIESLSSGATAFEVFTQDKSSSAPDLGIWYQGKLQNACLSDADQQFQIGFSGWDNSGKYFAFSTSNFVDNQIKSGLYMFDIQDNSLIEISSGKDANFTILGWQ